MVLINQCCKIRVLVKVFQQGGPPSLLKLGTRPDKLPTCLTSPSRDTLLIFLGISCGDGPPGSTTVTSQGQMTSRDYATSETKVNAVQDTGLLQKTSLCLVSTYVLAFTCTNSIKWTHITGMSRLSVSTFCLLNYSTNLNKIYTIYTLEIYTKICMRI